MTSSHIMSTSKHISILKRSTKLQILFFEAFAAEFSSLPYRFTAENRYGFEVSVTSEVPNCNLP